MATFGCLHFDEVPSDAELRYIFRILLAEQDQVRSAEVSPELPQNLSLPPPFDFFGDEFGSDLKLPASEKSIVDTFETPQNDMEVTNHEPDCFGPEEIEAPAVQNIAEAEEEKSDDAGKVFDKMPQRDIICSNTMLSAYYSACKYDNKNFPYSKTQPSATSSPLPHWSLEPPDPTPFPHPSQPQKRGIIGVGKKLNMEERAQAAATTTTSAVEDAKKRCAALSDQIQRIPRSKLSPSSKTTLCRLIDSELSYLHRLSAVSHLPFSPLSLNIGHLEAVVHVLRQPSVTGVSRVCKPVEFLKSSSIYVDIVCSLNGNPVWFIVSGRNPRCVSWNGGSSVKDKGLRKKIQQVVDAARLSPVTLQPSSVVLFFSNGIGDDIYQKLRWEFDSVDVEMEPLCYEEFELEEEWTNVVIGGLFPDACAVRIQIKKDGIELDEVEKDIHETRNGCLLSCNKYYKHPDLDLGATLCSLIDVMKCWCCLSNNEMELEVGSINQSWRDVETDLVNFDTTSLVAIVSGISNGRAGKLLATPECQLRDRFKGNYDFVISQVDSENQNPIHGELFDLISGKRGIICESVGSEFQELITMCGGANEKLRAEFFLKFLKEVPDRPSTRVMRLPTTRKLAMKNKVVFGTGDSWSAPTVTANMAFVRAVSQTGMSLSIIEHRPRALIGD